MKRKNAYGGIEGRTVEEQTSLTKQIVTLIRQVRWRIDQELTKKNVEPIFKENYRTYDKREFLIDSDVEFFKVKSLLEKNPKLLKDDPLLGLDYVKILSMIKRKKLVEKTTDHFNPTGNVDATYFDVGEEEEEKRAKIEADYARWERN